MSIFISTMAKTQSPAFVYSPRMQVVYILVRVLNILIEGKVEFSLVYTFNSQLMDRVLIYCAKITKAYGFIR